MMRMSMIMILALSAFAVPGPASALQASDTMTAWASATPEQKSKLVAELLKTSSGAPGVIKCLDAASQTPGHAALPIVEILKACRADSGEPV